MEIEFAADQDIVTKLKNLFEHFAAHHARSQSETILDTMTAAESGERHRLFDMRLVDERQKLLAKLLHAIALRMRFKIEQLEIFEGGYMPQGWNDVEAEQRVIRQYVADLSHGRRVVPIGIVEPREQ